MKTLFWIFGDAFLGMIFNYFMMSFFYSFLCLVSNMGPYFFIVFFFLLGATFNGCKFIHFLGVFCSTQRFLPLFQSIIFLENPLFSYAFFLFFCMLVHFCNLFSLLLFLSFLWVFYLFQCPFLKTSRKGSASLVVQSFFLQIFLFFNVILFFQPFEGFLVFKLLF